MDLLSGITITCEQLVTGLSMSFLLGMLFLVMYGQHRKTLEGVAGIVFILPFIFLVGAGLLTASSQGVDIWEPSYAGITFFSFLGVFLIVLTVGMMLETMIPLIRAGFLRWRRV